MKLRYVVLAVWLLVVFAFLALPWVLSHHLSAFFRRCRDERGSSRLRGPFPPWIDRHFRGALRHEGIKSIEVRQMGRISFPYRPYQSPMPAAALSSKSSASRM
jgi:hypothetical protein